MWSTRQLADVAGVTVRSIRHWHDVGLLPQPHRLSNNYKQYTAKDLVLVLRIKRLSELGFCLEQISAMLVSESDEQAALLNLREEVDTAIAQLTQTRDDIDRLLALKASPDLSPAAVEVFQLFSGEENAREMSIMLAHLLSGTEIAWLVNQLGQPPQEIMDLDREFSALAADASQEQQQDLIDRMVATAGKFQAVDDAEPAWGDRRFELEDVIKEFVVSALNTAQQQVMERVLQQLGQHSV